MTNTNGSASSHANLSSATSINPIDPTLAGDIVLSDAEFQQLQDIGALKVVSRLHRDRQDRIIVEVLVSNSGKFAALLHDDYGKLCARGLGLPWHANKADAKRAYVRKTLPGWGTETIARAILGAAPGEAVFYRDGNPYNLRPENLTFRDSGRACRNVGGYLKHNFPGVPA